ncbi:MAG: GNAT family N-acetyltransferase [Acidobacteriia bacterium]|nr:GNAT family N-acetyltransferase [Terriglobia bacterium]
MSLPVQAIPLSRVREASTAELRNWDQTLTRFAQHRVYHTIAWVRSIEKITAAQAVFLIYEKNGRKTACLPGFVRRLGPLKVFGSPFEGCQTESMGPLFDEKLATPAEFMPAFADYLEQRMGVQFIDLVARGLDAEEMHTSGFTDQPIFTYRAPLSPHDESETLARMKSNARNHLRKAIKSGLTVRLEHEEDFIPECYDQIREVFTRRGNAVPFGQERVRVCFRAMRDSGNLIALSVRLPETNQPVATGMFLADGRELILWCWTHRTEFRSHSPTELLMWTAMQEGMKRGCTSLDMTGGGDAKPKFGGVPDHSVRRWSRARHPWLFTARDFARRAYRLQQRVRGRLARAGSGTLHE